MGNALFRCYRTNTNDVVRVNHRRRSFWEKILWSCGFKVPSKQRRNAIIENVSSNYQRPGNVRPSENICFVDRLDTANQQSSVRYSSRSRSTSEASVSLTQVNHQESLLHTINKGRRVNRSIASNSFLSAISSNSPDTARRLFNRHCNYQKLQVCSPPSHSPQTTNGDSPDVTRMSFNPQRYQTLEAHSPPRFSSGSPDMTTLSFNPQCYQKLQGHNAESPQSTPSPSDSPDLTRMSFSENFCPQLPVSSPTSRASPISDSPDLTRMFDYHDSYKQQHVDRCLTSRSYPTSSSSVDLMRKSFNQHCNQQRHSAFQKKCHSPRRNNKPGSGKSSRRKRSGMRSTSQRTSNSKSPGRAASGDNEHKPNGMGSQSRKIYDSTSAGIAFSGRIEDNRDKSCKLRSVPDTASKVSKSLGRALKEDNNYEDNSDGLRSQSHKNVNVESPGRTVKWRIDDNELGGTPHPSFYEGRVAVVNVIPRSAALALIRRQNAFANRRNVRGSTEYCRRHWKPALESISEAGDWETF